MSAELKFLDLLQGLHTPVLDKLMCFVSNIGNAGALWILLAVLLLLIPSKRKCGTILIAALCVDVVLCNGLLKNIFCRIRPCDVNTVVQLLVPRPDDFSFPSGHTAAAFAAVTAVYLSREKKLFGITLSVACLMAFSRMYLYVHYPTDIIGGIIAGTVSAIIGYKALYRFKDYIKNSRKVKEF